MQWHLFYSLMTWREGRTTCDSHKITAIANHNNSRWTKPSPSLLFFLRICFTRMKDSSRKITLLQLSFHAHFNGGWKKKMKKKRFFNCQKMPLLDFESQLVLHWLVILQVRIVFALWSCLNKKRIIPLHLLFFFSSTIYFNILENVIIP